MTPRVAEAVILPHFHAVQDTFAGWAPRGGERLAKLDHVRFFVDPWVHDSPRHFAAMHVDGRRMFLAPDIANLPEPTLVAILAHEFGHAADFCYPGQWGFRGEGVPATWVEATSVRAIERWSRRDDDTIEWSADSIAYAVTGNRIGYCGRCMLQCFGGEARPEGLQ